MSQYSTGTASVTNGSPTVTGSGTLWSANVSAADSFTIAGDGVMYDVASVDSDTQVTLSVAYAGSTASGAVYAIGTSFTVPDNFPEMSQGDIETATIFTRGMRKIQGKISALVSDISGKANQATTYTETEVDALLDDKAAISGQVFTGDIAAPKITASTGVLFGTDTAAANTLDDYEEGDWTPVADAGITGWAFLESATYVKIGNLVTVNVFISSVTGNDANQIQLSGLPFTSKGDRHFSPGPCEITELTTSSDSPFARTTSSDDTLRFYKGAREEIVGNDIIGNGNIICTVTYQSA